MRLLIIDNYDSFTYNLVQYTEAFVERLDVRRNDEISLKEVDAYDAIILSPGPGTPKDTGISMEVIRRYASKKKILGVCMGMQVIAEAFGGKLLNLEHPLHGVAVETYLTKSQDPMFKGLPEAFMTGRYHSWIVDEDYLPKDFIITAKDKYGSVQAIRHRTYPLSAVQFHPESVLTEYGRLMIENWVNL